MTKKATLPCRVSRIKTFLRRSGTRIPTAVAPALPERSAQKSSRVDKAYDEYCDRLAAGEEIDPSSFCERYPDVRSTLYCRIEVHEFLEEHPETLEYLEPIPWPQPGDVFGDCTLTEELGRGGVGRVYLAQEKELPRHVVLKLAAVENREAERICKLNQRNIVPVYYVRRDKKTGLTAICMPFESRHTLIDVLDEAFQDGTPPRYLDDILRPLFPDRFSAAAEEAAAGAVRNDDSRCSLSYVDGVLQIGQKLADALAHSHREGIYHLDLKPSNVLIKHDGAPLLIDFNMAIDDNQHGECVGGTKPYMSPEQLRCLSAPPAAETDQLDGRSDVYSLALILCRLLTGQHPVGDLSPNATEQQLLSWRQDWTPKQLKSSPHVDSKTVQLLAQCLSFDPQLRPTAAELSVSLQDTLRRRQESSSRRKLLASALLAGSALFAGALVTGSRELDHLGFYDEGLSHLDNGRHDEAIKSFSRSLEVKEKFAPALIALASIKETRQDFGSAIGDYERAYEWTQNPELKARMGYCAAKRNSLLDAVTWLNDAIEGGFRTVAVFNNLGYCQMKLRDFHDAEINLTKALESNPKLQAPWYNHALNGLNRSEARHVPIPETAVNNIQKARETGKDGPMLLYYAAAIWDRVPSKSPHRDVMILELLEKSLEMGLDSNVLIGQSPRFQELRNTPEFNALVGQPRPARRVTFRPHLLQVDSTPPSIVSFK